MISATTTLSLGDSAPLFALADPEGAAYILRDHAGKPAFLYFYASDEIDACADIARRCRDLHPVLADAGVALISISMDRPEVRRAFAKTHGLDFPLLSDPTMHVSQQYGICFGVAEEATQRYVRTGFLLDANHHIVRIYSLTEPEETLKILLADLPQVLWAETPRQIALQAPVLLIPKVLSDALCRELMTVWQTQGNEDSGFMKRQGEETQGLYDYSFKIRRDHFIRDDSLRGRLDDLMKRRVFPEIEKAFNYTCTRREDYKIACYEASRGGFFRQHRDNTSGGTAHRRWAMTLNLNAGEYEGGLLRFPEYSPHLYRPETGSAVIFSCSLMHEATPVTQGDRFALLSFFYSDVEAEARKQYEDRHGAEYLSPPKLAAPNAPTD